MNRGKDLILSSCERTLVLDAVKERQRLDGRGLYDYRLVEIAFRNESGYVEVKLGNTRVLACATCEVIKPQPNRPTEGKLFFDVDLSPMASPAFEVGRHSAQATEIGRILERCLKESRAVDTESLCIIAGQKVWAIHIDIHVLNHSGNIIDCAVLAAITALKHFKRPDVTVVGEEATIHPVTERDLIPLNVHHMPLCVTFAFFQDGNTFLVDPTFQEERVMNGRLIFGLNIHKEICALQMIGGVSISPDEVMKYVKIATVKCAELTEAVKNALLKSLPPSKPDIILNTRKAKENLAVPSYNSATIRHIQLDSAIQNKKTVSRLGEGTAQLGEGEASTWTMDDTDEDDDTAKKAFCENAIYNEEGSSEEENKVLLMTL